MLKPLPMVWVQAMTTDPLSITVVSSLTKTNNSLAAKVMEIKTVMTIQVMKN